MDSKDVDRSTGSGGLAIPPRNSGFRRRGRTAWRDRPSLDRCRELPEPGRLPRRLDRGDESLVHRPSRRLLPRDRVQTRRVAVFPTRPEPAEYTCHARLTPSKGIEQPRIPSEETDQGLAGRLLRRQRFVTDRSDCVLRPQGRCNLAPLVADAQARIVEDGRRGSTAWPTSTGRSTHSQATPGPCRRTVSRVPTTAAPSARRIAIAMSKP